MAEKTKNSEGPNCACGKVDLYDEWLKNEAKKKEEADKADVPEEKKNLNSADE